ncbi:DNA polymerase III subunit psi [uncultured Ferrimonas sp.]|uniref:DNA polymerase III subunit psi n=1 Tax=uncultured Ferrimonas sp. TaxID=432640 RepID=UPI002602BA14|nr:DNA polymerase III subunit psi [uncultured Ferrimonas sp.]
MSKLSERQIAALQQMGITPYQVPAKPAELCLVNVGAEALQHPLILDVLQLLQLTPEQCTVAACSDDGNAKRYWQLKHDMPTRPTHLHTAALAELAEPAAKRRLWQRLQSWL